MEQLQFHLRNVADILLLLLGKSKNENKNLIKTFPRLSNMNEKNLKTEQKVSF